MTLNVETFSLPHLLTHSALLTPPLSICLSVHLSSSSNRTIRRKRESILSGDKKIINIIIIIGGFASSVD